VVDTAAILIPELSRRICAIFNLDPLATLASGALLLSAQAEDAGAIISALESAGITCREIGRVEEGSGEVFYMRNGARHAMPRPVRDEIARVYEHKPA